MELSNTRGQATAPSKSLPLLNSLYSNFRGFSLAILLVNGIIALLLIVLVDTY